MMSHLFILTFIVIFQHSSQKPLLNLNTKGCAMQRSVNNINVFLTLSSITVSTNPSGIVKRHLEVNWIGGHYQSGDNVGIYNTNPLWDPYAKPLSSVDPTDYPGGYFRSDVELSILFFNLSSLTEDPCLGFWGAYRNKNGSVLSSSCLQTRPFWMQQNSRFLANLSLPEIMIPGSHDSGSFYFHKEIALLSKYKYAQDESIFNQLVYGLRYFDLRVGYYFMAKDKYYINHSFLRTQHSVRSVLHQVKEFIEATKEIVILDFHNFPIGFINDAIHIRLMDNIVRIFKPYIIPYKKRYELASFRTLWEENKRILISYDSKVREKLYSNLLWPSIPRAWGNKQYPKDLKNYFKEVFAKPTPVGLWASMAELTPNTRTIILHPETGLRIFADEINRNVTHWFRDLYWHKANIVATDYFLGNNIIDVAVETNRIKGTCPKHMWKR